MKMYFPDDSFDFKSKWKSADNYWQFGTWYNPYRIALIKVLALMKKCAKSQNVRREFPDYTRGCVHFTRCYSSFASARQRAAPVICSTLYPPVCVSQLLLFACSASLSRNSQLLEKLSAANLTLTQSSFLEKCAENNWQGSEAFRES